MVTVTENQHVQNQHIIPPVSLQLATATQTYSLFFQPLAKFGFYHLLTQPSTDSHSESATPPNPKTCLPIKSVIGLSLPLHADWWLFEPILLLGWFLQHWIPLFWFTWFHSYPFPIHLLFIYVPGLFFSENLLLFLLIILYYFEHKG